MKYSELKKILKRSGCFLKRHGTRQDITEYLSIYFKCDTRKDNNMSKYTFPAILTPDVSGAYSVRFPDIAGCHSCGDDLPDAILMAEDALALMLCMKEDSDDAIPLPSDPGSILTTSGEIVTLIACDTLGYRRRFSNKAVKKTLTIPEWLNDAACKAGINFSQLLQEALIGKLGL